MTERHKYVFNDPSEPVDQPQAASAGALSESLKYTCPNCDCLLYIYPSDQQLATHDQKVRADLIVDVLEILVNAICERPEGKSWLVGPGEVWRAVQALAAPAASKPEAGPK